jgi:hypothetical protein
MKGGLYINDPIYMLPLQYYYNQFIIYWQHIICFICFRCQLTRDGNLCTMSCDSETLIWKYQWSSPWVCGSPHRIEDKRTPLTYIVMVRTFPHLFCPLLQYLSAPAYRINNNIYTPPAPSQTLLSLNIATYMYLRIFTFCCCWLYPTDFSVQCFLWPFP